ncbi:conserved protein, unknown function [Hepatocystis sp. ex Piliocolobus tephrosceles]|nr:conserved protein, unknown function [Hepatocystis sp. ex Piliocolobus tephrosceles]
MHKLILFFAILVLSLFTQIVGYTKHANKRKRKNVALKQQTNLNNNLNDYSFLLTKDNDKEKESGQDNNNSNEKKTENTNKENDKKTEDNNSSNEKKEDSNNSSDKKEEGNNSSDKKEEGNNSSDKKEENTQNSMSQTMQSDKRINRTNLTDYGTYDKNGKFIPSYKTLTDEILATNSAMERASTFMKVACSHILKILEFIPESKLSTQYIKVESKTIYLKDIVVECENIFFNVEKLVMTVIVLNSKVQKYVYAQN